MKSRKTKWLFRPRIRQLLRELLTTNGWHNISSHGGDYWEPKFRQPNRELSIEFNERTFTLSEVEHPLSEGWSIRNYPLSKRGIGAALGTIGISCKLPTIPGTPREIFSLM